MVLGSETAGVSLARSGPDWIESLRPPPTTANARCSVRTCRTSRTRGAPNAVRTTISLCRAAPRESRRWATLAHAINRITPVAQNKSSRTVVASPTSALCRGSRVTPHASLLSGYASANRLPIVSISAAASGRRASGCRRPITRRKWALRPKLASAHATGSQMSMRPTGESVARDTHESAVRGRHQILSNPVRAVFPQRDEPLRFGERQLSEQDGMNHAEDRRVYTDPQSQGERRHAIEGRWRRGRYLLSSRLQALREESQRHPPLLREIWSFQHASLRHRQQAQCVSGSFISPGARAPRSCS